MPFVHGARTIPQLAWPRTSMSMRLPSRGSSSGARDARLALATAMALQASDRRYGFSELLRLEVRSGDVLEGVEIVVPDERELLARREADGGGVGVRLEFEPAGPKIRSLLPGMPAEEAGLLVDDRIVSLGGMDTRFMAPSEFIHRCRGAVGEPVTLGVRTGEEPPRDVVLLRRVLESRAR